MNCKPGDLVVYVGRHVPSLGATAVALRAVDCGDRMGWILDRPIVSISSLSGKPEPLRLVGDAALRPIRDQDGEDETLTWAGKPSDIKTPEAA